MTSCFASFVDDVLRALLRRRDLLFARDLAGLLCATLWCFAPSRRSTQRRRVNFLAFGLSLPLLPLSPLEEVLAFPCLFLFLSRREITEEHSRTGTPTACIRCAFFYLLFLAVQAQQPKNFARFAPLCAPRAINSTPSGGEGHPICTNKRT